MRKTLENFPGLQAVLAVAPLFQSVGLVAIIGFAFWLGQMQRTLSQQVEKVQKVSEIVVESNESLVVRTKVLETELQSIHGDSQKTLDLIDKHNADINKHLGDLIEKLSQPSSAARKAHHH